MHSSGSLRACILPYRCDTGGYAAQGALERAAHSAGQAERARSGAAAPVLGRVRAAERRPALTAGSCAPAARFRPGGRSARGGR